MQYSYFDPHKQQNRGILGNTYVLEYSSAKKVDIAFEVALTNYII